MVKQMFAGGGGQNLQTNLLTRNIKEFNVIILILITTLIIGISGVSSLALFSGETSSSGKITGTVIRGETPTGVETLIKKVGTGGLVQESHPVTTQLAATTAYRYTGKNPDNYVKFNNELWRIIGIFEVDDGNGKLENRIKIVRNSSIGNIAWNDYNSDIYGIYTDGDWSASTTTGRLLLNSGDYWYRTGSYASTGLTEESRAFLANAKWYLGGASSSSSPIDFYKYERGTEVNGGYGKYSTDKVGLIYPSDYGYATSGGTTVSRDTCLSTRFMQWMKDNGNEDCYNNDWLYNNDGKWTITPDLIGYVYKIQPDGWASSNGPGLTLPFYPTAYLKPSIKITGGTGTSSSPYQLELPDLESTGATKTIIEKSGTNGIVKAVKTGTQQTYGGYEYRYTGKNPNNYVNFNSELWRIIGVFDVENEFGKLEKRIKLIRKDSIGESSWNTGSYSSTIYNNWSESAAKKLLNDGYYWKRENDYETTGLTEEAKLLISNSKWYLGGITSTTAKTQEYYEAERNYKSSPSSSSNWVGKVGIIYPSDYGYATDGGSSNNRKICLETSNMFNWRSYNYCFSNDWLYDGSTHQWTITPSTENNIANYISTDGSLTYNQITYSYGLKPSVYLRSKVKITSGTGSSTNPYQLSYTPVPATDGAKTIIDKAGTDGLIEETKPDTRDIEATTDYRYTGANPNNYVSFNNELWRIIGVFDVNNGKGKIEKRIKLIRKDSLGSLAWDTNNTNDWTKSSSMALLNSGDYWNRSGSYATNGLKSEAKQMIDDAKWYLGSISNINKIFVEDYYTSERGITVYTGNPISWTGKVGLMYPSDYGYATSGETTTNTRTRCLTSIALYNWNNSSLIACKNNDWLYLGSSNQWTLTTMTGGRSGVSLNINSDGSIINATPLTANEIKPTVYLKSSIRITGGTGTESDPYQLSL